MHFVFQGLLRVYNSRFPIYLTRILEILKIRLVNKLSIVLKTENLTKSYNKTVVVDHLTLHVNKGEIVCLLGPNGADKSTILKMLTTLLKPDEGAAYINGYNIVKEQYEVRKSISYAPQELVFYILCYNKERTTCISRCDL